MFQSVDIKAQQVNIAGFSGLQEILNADLYDYGKNNHPGIRSTGFRNQYEKGLIDSIYTSMKCSRKKSFLCNDLLTFHKEPYRAIINPMVSLSAGYDTYDKKLLHHGALGLTGDVKLGKNWNMGGYFLYQNASFPVFLTDKIKKSRVFPASEYANSVTDRVFQGIDYSAFVSYRFYKYFLLEAGLGKNFWGDGYRSLFLSDQTSSYPYVKLETEVWNIKLINLYTKLDSRYVENLPSGVEKAHKYGAFHYLSWNISKRVNLGFFESIIWEGKDTAGNRGFDLAYLNPLLFYRPVEFSRGSPDNSLLGLSLRVKVGRKTSFYGQLLIDDMIFSETTRGIAYHVKKIFGKTDSSSQYGHWASKQAWQIGVKSYDMFGIRNFSGLLEFNCVRPYTYAHRRVTQNYSFNNQPLAHPAGANFWEISTFLWYKYRRYFFELHLNYLVTGLDSVNTNYGQDIFKPVWDVYEPELNNIPVQQYYNKISQGIKTKIVFIGLNISYLLNHKNGLRFFINSYYRNSFSDLKKEGFFVFNAGIKIYIQDQRPDF